MTLFAAVLHAPPGLADSVHVPLELNEQLLELVTRERAFTEPGGRVRLNDDGTGCQFLELSDPRVRIADGRVLVRANAAARSGRALGGNRCMLIIDWRGQVELTQTPAIGSDGRSIVLHTESWRALRPDGRTDDVTTTIGRWLERFLPTTHEQMQIDLEQPLTELEQLLTQIAPGDTLAHRVTIDELAAANNRATVTLRLDYSPRASPPLGAEPVLSATELALLEQRLNALDAFFTHSVKALTPRDGAIDPDALLAVLLDLRMKLVRILGDDRRHDPDPARALFVDAWNGLAPTVRAIAEQPGDARSAIRYASFLSAGDALNALDTLGPAAGIEVSAEGLRRLARILTPDVAVDPLQRSDAVDAELRRSLGFGEPLPPPRPGVQSSWIDRLFPSAFAATSLDPAAVKKLNSWVPKNSDMAHYLPMVRDVLRHVTTEQLRARPLEAAYHDVFRWLVLAAAWQESCWRQFVARNDKRVPMMSRSGDIGMMQINPRVWRGFYDVQGLRWDIVYNARAGAEILQHHMITYAIGNREHRSAIDNLARSAYAAYNGGPAAFDRYRRADAPARGKKVDALFYERYREIKKGRELAVTACYAG